MIKISATLKWLHYDMGYRKFIFFTLSTTGGGGWIPHAFINFIRRIQSRESNREKSNIFTLDVREAYKFNKNEMAKVFWDTLYTQRQ